MFIQGNIIRNHIDADELAAYIGQKIQLHGYIYKIREMSGFAFIILRTKHSLIQCLHSPEKAKFLIGDISEGSSVIFTGEVVSEPRSKTGAEIHLTDVEILSSPLEAPPVVINGKEISASLETLLDFRPLTLRNEKEHAIFKIQEGLSRGFREYLTKNKFTEIHTPKIVFAGAEGGANIFKLGYFGNEAFLTQSPQFYKQCLVGVYERVFEIAPVFRAEKHDTSRHLNEYISCDFEMGFIDSFVDIMEMETALLKYTFDLIENEYTYEKELLKVQIPKIEGIPSMKFMEAKQILAEKLGYQVTDYEDFEPEEEKLICNYIKKEFNCEFVFITHYPSSKRPFYAMDDPTDTKYTLSFDLLFRGLEVTTGGQRINNYLQQVEKMNSRGMVIEGFESYLMAHKYGLPPHGGLGIGLERLTMKLLNQQNIRLSSMFPRDTGRLIP